MAKDLTAEQRTGLEALQAVRAAELGLSAYARHSPIAAAGRQSAHRILNVRSRSAYLAAPGRLRPAAQMCA
jgi:hypothetical protein